MPPKSKIENRYIKEKMIYRNSTAKYLYLIRFLKNSYENTIRHRPIDIKEFDELENASKGFIII